MFESIINFFKNLGKREYDDKSKEAAKERLHLVLMQDRANVSADFLELMKQEIIDVIKKYIDVDETEMDVRLTNKTNSDGTTGAPALYANIPIVSIKNEAKKANREIAKMNSENDKMQNDEGEAAPTKKTKKSEVEKKKKIVKKQPKEGEKKVKTSEKLTGNEVKKVAKKVADKVSNAMNTAKSTATKKKVSAKKDDSTTKKTSDEVK